MKYVLIIGFILLSHWSFSQNKRELEEVVEKMRVAMLAEDAETLRALTSEDLNYGHSNGTIETQREFLQVFETKSQDYLVWDIKNLEVDFHAGSLAMVRYDVHAEISTQGNINRLDLGLLMIWIKEAGAWKLLARQAFRYPKD